MAVQTFNTLAELSAAAKQQLAEYDVVSFDIFDTLFIRRVHDPDLVKQPVARFIHNLAEQSGIWSSYDSVQKLRDRIESEHRQLNGQTNPDFEANYAQFMPDVLQELFGDSYTEQLLQQVVDYEVQMENTMLVPRQEIVALLEYFQQQGKRLFLLSDMYLPADLIRRLVVDKGLEHYFEDIISSADSFRAKASGTAFPLIKERHQLDESSWLHIGDNPISDGFRPDEFGIRSMVIDDTLEKKRKGLARRYEFYGKKLDLWNGRYLQQLMLPLEAENVERSELYADGYNFFAYLLGTALCTLKSRADSLGINQLYFCAREGWMLKRCWEIMAPVLWPEEAQNYELHYFYVSRLSLAQASRANAGLSIFDAENALRPMHNRDFTDIARVYGLDVDALQPFLARHELAIDEELSADRRSIESYKKLVALCDDEEFNATVKTLAQPNNDALMAYLEELNFFQNQRIALIDIGWLSTIQHYLVKAIDHRETKPIVNGFLLATDDVRFYDKTSHSETEGLIFDVNDFASLPWLMTTCKDVFEEVTRAEHPTLLGYELDQTKAGKAYTLRFRSAEDASAKAETEQFNYYKDIHAGVFDGVQRFAAALSVSHFDHRQIKNWCHMLIMGRLGFPESQEMVRLRNFAHQDDFAREARKGERKSRAVRKLERYHKNIWSESPSKVRFNPLLKLWHFMKFMRRLRQR
ncbi:MAG: HAD family hydrolase [Arenicella sp.]